VAIPEPETELVVHRSVVGRRCVLRVDGEIDVLTIPLLQAAIDEALDMGALELWLDFTPTDFMDSTGLHALLETHSRIGKLNRSLIVICPQGTPVHRLLELSGAGELIDLHPDVGSAQRAA
jgi:anti-anti-sigma factor